MKPSVITIVGPTAAGKTALAVHLARRLGSVVISGDAFQVYRGLNIGTAKVTAEEAEGVPHELVDILDPSESYSAARFCSAAAAIIRRENDRGRIPILAGGTGLYVQSLLEGYTFLPKGDGAESRWHAFYRERGMEGLLEEIRRRAPAAEIPPDPQRRIRLLELLDLGISEPKAGKSGKLIYTGPVIGLTMDRAWLYERINERVRTMVRRGLLQEVQALLAAGVAESAQSMRGIGYKEMIPVVRGEVSLEEAEALIQKNTRHFAKRQLTWYRRMPYIRWFTRERAMEESLWQEEIEKYVVTQIRGEVQWKER